MNKVAAFVSWIAVALAATAAVAQQPGMKVNVLVVESVDDFRHWLMQKPAPKGLYPPSLKVVPVGKKVHFPIVVGGLNPPEKGVLTLVADMEFIGPDGKKLPGVPKCCRETITNRPDFRTVLMGNALNLEFDPGDLKGKYTVRVSLTDGSRTVTSSETFQVTAGKSAGSPAAAAPMAAPKVRTGVPSSGNAGRNGDKRDCLSLPTQAEIIKCTEQK